MFGWALLLQVRGELWLWPLPCAWAACMHGGLTPPSLLPSRYPQALTPALYMGFYYAMTVFDTPFGLYYVVLFFVAWWGYGVGYLFSVLLEANNALLGGLCVTLIFGGIINGINPTVASADGNALMTGLQYLSYTRCGGVAQCGYRTWCAAWGPGGEAKACCVRYQLRHGAHSWRPGERQAGRRALFHNALSGLQLLLGMRLEWPAPLLCSR